MSRPCLAQSGHGAPAAGSGASERPNPSAAAHGGGGKRVCGSPLPARKSRREFMAKRPGRSAVFLDRDGVINVSPGRGRHYVTTWEQFRFLPGALRALKTLRRAGKTVIVVTNQSAVGRGLLSRRRLDEIHRRMRAEVSRTGGRIQAVYVCPHRPADHCPCRKPKPGLLRRAARAHSLDLTRCVFVGDHVTDIRLARRVGCPCVLVLTGHTSRAQARRMRPRPDRVARNLAEAVRWLLENDLAPFGPKGASPQKGQKVPGLSRLRRNRR